MKQILVTIDKQGNTTVQTSGFAGAECQKETAALEGLLGSKSSDTPTAEMYQQPAQTKIGTGR